MKKNEAQRIKDNQNYIARYSQDLNPSLLIGNPGLLLLETFIAS